jgi:hypothetical protein
MSETENSNSSEEEDTQEFRAGPEIDVDEEDVEETWEWDGSQWSKLPLDND